MRITGPSGSQPTNSTRRAGSVSAGGSGFASHLTEESGDTPSSSGAGAARATTSLDALIALQGVGSEGKDERRRATKRGKEALDVLDDLRLGLLSGHIDAGVMLRLTGAVGHMRERSGEAGLDDVLDAIELRAAVELAKFQKSNLQTI